MKYTHEDYGAPYFDDATEPRDSVVGPVSYAEPNLTEQELADWQNETLGDLDNPPEPLADGEGDDSLGDEDWDEEDDPDEPDDDASVQGTLNGRTTFIPFSVIEKAFDDLPDDGKEGTTLAQFAVDAFHVDPQAAREIFDEIPDLTEEQQLAYNKNVLNLLQAQQQPNADTEEMIKELKAAIAAYERTHMPDSEV